MLVCMCAQSLQSCLTPCNPVDYSPGSSVHGILQAKILEWVAMPSSWGIIRYYDMKNEWSELSFSRIFNYSMENKHHKSQRNPQTKNSTLYIIFFSFLILSPVKLVTVPIWVITVTQRLVDAFAHPIPLERNVLNVRLVPGATASPLVVRWVNCFISFHNVI